MAPVWMNLYAPVTPAHLAAQDAQGWIVDSLGNLYFYDDSLSAWTQQNSLPTSSIFVDLSASTDGTLAAVDALGDLYVKSGASWSQLFISTLGTSNTAVGDSSSIAIVDTSGAITASSNSINSSLSSGPVRLSATPALSEVWGVNSTNTVYKWNFTSSSWTTISGKSLVQVHASHSTLGATQIVGVDSTGKGWSYNTSAGTWSAVATPNVGDHFAWLEAGAGYIWAILTSGSVYRGFI